MAGDFGLRACGLGVTIATGEHVGRRYGLPCGQTTGWQGSLAAISVHR